MSVKQHDLLVIGAGPGGYVAAIRAAQLGLNVGLIEREAALGGTCLRIGCIPSKALLESSERFAEAGKHLGEHGIRVGKIELDLAVMMERKTRVVTTMVRGLDSLIKKNKITRYHGEATLDAPGKIKVRQPKETIELQGKFIIIATGSNPSSLKGVEQDGDRIGTSTTALSYPQVPSHLVVIGAGYIGLELGSVWRRLGARVTIIEYANRILPGMDADACGLLVE